MDEKSMKQYYDQLLKQRYKDDNTRFKTIKIDVDFNQKIQRNRGLLQRRALNMNRNCMTVW